MSKENGRRKYNREQLQWIGPLNKESVADLASKAVENMETILIRDLRANMKKLFGREDMEIKEEDITLSPYGSAIVGKSFQPVFKQKLPEGGVKYWQISMRQTGDDPDSPYDPNTSTIMEVTDVVKPMIDN